MKLLDYFSVDRFELKSLTALIFAQEMSNYKKIYQSIKELPQGDRTANDAQLGRAVLAYVRNFYDPEAKADVLTKYPVAILILKRLIQVRKFHDFPVVLNQAIWDVSWGAEVNQLSDLSLCQYLLSRVLYLNRDFTGFEAVLKIYYSSPLKFSKGEWIPTFVGCRGFPGSQTLQVSGSRRQAWFPRIERWQQSKKLEIDDYYDVPETSFPRPEGPTLAQADAFYEEFALGDSDGPGPSSPLPGVSNGHASREDSGPSERNGAADPPPGPGPHALRKKKPHWVHLPWHDPGWARKPCGQYISFLLNSAVPEEVAMALEKFDQDQASCTPVEAEACRAYVRLKERAEKSKTKSPLEEALSEIEGAKAECLAFMSREEKGSRLEEIVRRVLTGGSQGAPDGSDEGGKPFAGPDEQDSAPVASPTSAPAPAPTPQARVGHLQHPESEDSERAAGSPPPPLPAGAQPGRLSQPEGVDSQPVIGSTPVAGVSTRSSRKRDPATRSAPATARARTRKAPVAEASGPAAGPVETGAAVAVCTPRGSEAVGMELVVTASPAAEARSRPPPDAEGGEVAARQAQSGGAVQLGPPASLQNNEERAMGPFDAFSSELG